MDLGPKLPTQTALVAGEHEDDDRYMALQLALPAPGRPEAVAGFDRHVLLATGRADIGVHGKPATLHLEELWIRHVTMTTGLVDAFSTPTLLKLIGAGQLDPSQLVTHHFHLDEFEQADEVFGNPAETSALKVVVTPM